MISLSNSPRIFLFLKECNLLLTVDLLLKTVVSSLRVLWIFFNMNNLQKIVIISAQHILTEIFFDSSISHARTFSTPAPRFRPGKPPAPTCTPLHMRSPMPARVLHMHPAPCACAAET